jgi:hypothetical protein
VPATIQSAAENRPKRREASLKGRSFGDIHLVTRVCDDLIMGGCRLRTWDAAPSTGDAARAGRLAPASPLIAWSKSPLFCAQCGDAPFRAGTTDTLVGHRPVVTTDATPREPPGKYLKPGIRTYRFQWSNASGIWLGAPLFAPRPKRARIPSIVDHLATDLITARSRTSGRRVRHPPLDTSLRDRADSDPEAARAPPEPPSTGFKPGT